VGRAARPRRDHPNRPRAGSPRPRLRPNATPLRSRTNHHTRLNRKDMS
jgi:hypothetical protein